MKATRVAAWTFPAIVLLAALLRLPGLDIRPMHADEAVQAAKMGQLLEQGRYEYDPAEFHGPALNYLTRVPAWLRGAERYRDLDEFTLRVVPAVAGVMLVAAHALLVPVLGFRASAIAALFAAVSPGMVYYGRYYIHETLLVAFSFGALVSLCRYLQARLLRWAVLTGACVGLMHATKETWVIALASMAAAIPLGVIFARWRGHAAAAHRASFRVAHLAGGIAAAVVVSGSFFSSFLAHPRGIADSLLAYGTYVERASGAASWHAHPWYYYFDVLLYLPSSGGPAWSEGLIVGLAAIGLLAAASRDGVPGADRGLLAFIGFYAVLIGMAYSSIPYKTPWCVLGFLHALVLLAGVGAVRLLSVSGRGAARAVVAAFLVAAGAHLGWQAWAGSFRFGADPRNPYVYAHTGTGVFDIALRVEGLARADPRREGMPIEIISGENLWPLPWYLRRFPDVRWQTRPVEGAGNAPVILSTPEVENEVVRKLYEVPPPGERELYVSIFDGPVELRPGVEVRGYAVKSLWDHYRQRVAVSPENGLTVPGDRE